MQDLNGVWRSLVVWVATVAVGAGIGTLAGAGLIPGGGPTKSDCYAELDVAGIENGTQRVEKNKKVLCTDGEACDTGPCGDGICIMKVAVCRNQTDPSLTDCTPPPGLDQLKVKGLANVQIPQVLEGSACGAFLDVEVSTKKKGTKVGKLNVKVTAKAPKGTKPRTDQDAYQLQCVPRTVACPASPSGAFLD